MTMGTASTMACMVEALGIGMPGNAAIPAVDARRNVLARDSRAGASSRWCDEDLMLSKILTREAFENAIRVNAGDRRLDQRGHPPDRDRAAASASTSALDDWDRLGRDVPCLVNLMPSGEYLMEDFYYAGGLPVVIASSRSTACCTTTR